jgi:hypothetical protein
MKVEHGNSARQAFRAGGLLHGESKMTEITVRLPPDVVARIDELREVELLSRSNWLRREVVLAVRETIAPSIGRMEAKGTA